MKLQDKKWNVLLEIFDHIQDYMNLNHWDISWQGFSTWELGSTVQWRLDRCSHSYFLAEVLFDNTLLYKQVDDYYINEILRILVHELCHIYTGAGSQYLLDDVNEHNLTNRMGRFELWDIKNKVIFVEEQMTNLLDDVIYRWLKIEKKFTDLVEELKKLCK